MVRSKTLKSKIHIGKIISKRILATVFEGNFKSEKCVWKIEHVKNQDKENKNSEIWNELNFSLVFGNNHPEHFMTLLHSYFGNCSKVELMFDLDDPPALWGQKLVQEYKDIVKEGICLHKAYTKMDVMLNDIVSELNLKQIYSMILQTSYALELLHKNNYIHGDFHFGNVGAIKTSQSATKKLGNIVVQTYGYDWKLIDFGMILHKSNASSKEDKKRYQKGDGSNYTFVESFSTVIQSSNNIGFIDILQKLKKQPEYESLEGITKDKNLIWPLFMTLFPHKYSSLFSGETVQHQNLSTADLIFFSHHGVNSDVVRNYLLEKI